MTSTATINASLAHTMDGKSMTFFQWRAIGLCFLINMLDGFDVMVMAFTAASVSAHWSLTGTQLGYLLSAGLVGMTVGSLFVAPWADRIGRRPLVLLCIVVAGGGMIASGYATAPTHLGLLRFVTGLGIGGILASSYVIAGEYASKRWRSLAISLQATAYALGATVGGFITSRIIALSGWESVFFYGGVATLATLPVLYAWLPESIDFYLSRRPKGALARVNALMRKMGMAPLQALPAETADGKTGLRGSLAYLLSPSVRRATALIWVSFFLILFGFYFVMSWSPRLLVAAGLSNEQGITGGVLLNLGGIVGTSLIGLLAGRMALYKVHAIYLIATAVLMSALLSLAGSGGQTLVVAFLLGVFVNGCVAGVFAMTPMVYESGHRVTGLGWGIGMGRLGSILAPLAAGPLIDARWSPGQVYSLYATAFVLAAITVVMLHFAIKGRPAERVGKTLHS
ncbi:MFS transporter [Cupriavidus necator]|uniref:MFS transporter n=1 Tax=Cupriavidus necator TaxID=106590 RepID=UPI003F73D3F4